MEILPDPRHGQYCHVKWFNGLFDIGHPRSNNFDWTWTFNSNYFDLTDHTKWSEFGYQNEINAEKNSRHSSNIKILKGRIMSSENVILVTVTETDGQRE
ncbi:12739_t:CDS:2 [Gigaspora rosea]|nr:12739_t:CDS:2 [Gigaspora rosea]